MNPHLDIATRAARAAGQLLRDNFSSDLKVDAAHAHDIKLELDVRTQDLITGILLGTFPDHSILGEEGVSGNPGSACEWVVDPIDGTVNYFYGIPHFCISIALREHGETSVGVIYDPMRDELWTAARGGAASLNDRPIRVSPRTQLSEAILTVGFAKNANTINAGLPLLEKMIHRARKCRMMGSAALDLAYVACGRLDAYIEEGVSVWDIAAGALLVEMAGGKIDITPRADEPDKLAVIAWNGTMDLGLY